MRTLLVVDDEKIVREGLRRVFVSEGFRVLTAMNGREALKLIAREPVDVVLCDLVMPVMGALELLERARISRPGLPVIVITGRGTAASAVECGKMGAYGFVRKPFRTGDVLALVKCAVKNLPPPGVGQRS